MAGKGKWGFAAPIVGLLAACVPADGALPLGAAQFTITARASGREHAIDGYEVRIDRFLIAFRTMTIVNLKNSDQCAYRGQGHQSNVLFDGVEGTVVQSFNGMKPGPCPDVGLRLAPPDDRTQLGEGAKVDDLVSFVSGAPSVAQLEVTATRDEDVRHIVLRFDMARSPSAFGGCRETVGWETVRGATPMAGARDAKLVAFDTSVFFRMRLFQNPSLLAILPFFWADARGNDDHTTTMQELDELPLSNIGYELPPPEPSDAGVRPTAEPSFGDFVRAQFLSAVHFGKDGECDGLPAGTKLDE